jgi:hypothetical protein
VVPPVESVEAPVQTETVVVHSDLWQRVSEALMIVWLLTLAAWWWSRRRPAPKVDEPRELPVHKQQTRCLKTARKAALANDSNALKAALLAWGRLQWPDESPRNIGDLAARVTMPLSTELNELCRASYGPGSDWDGAGIAKSLRSFSVLGDDDADSTPKDLPPLLPT